MKKIRITEQQYKRLVSEIDGVKGGINRVDKTFKKVFTGADVKKLTPNNDLMEDDFDIKDPVPGIPNSRMKKSAEPEKFIDEDIFSPEFHEAIRNFIQNIWMNPSQKGLDRIFVQNGITWGDIITYLTSVGVITGVGAGLYKVNNFFKTAFSKDKKEATQQKMQDLEKITKMVEKDPEAPWNQETTYEKKQRMQARPDSGFKAEPKPFNPNRFKPGLSEDEPEVEKSTFKPVGMGKELAILNGPDGMYIFDYANSHIPNEDLNIETIADFVNNNLETMSKGEGVESFEKGDDLVKIDEKLREELGLLYNKDKEFIKLLNKLEEMTGAASAGAFTGALGAGKPQISPGYSPAEIINDEEEIYGKKVSEYGKHQKMSDKIVGKVAQSVNRGKKQVDDLRAQHYETDRTRPNYPLRNDDLPLDKFLKAKEKGTIEETDTAGTPQSSATGQYTQPKVWAKDKANWAGAHRTQYPHGEMVDFDPCTKLNNNKSAQNGKCSQGAVDHVVKTHQTKDSVISKSMYETIAEKTGRTVEDVKRIIESRINKQ